MLPPSGGFSRCPYGYGLFVLSSNGPSLGAAPAVSGRYCSHSTPSHSTLTLFHSTRVPENHFWILN
jgi:hypothetical protein